MCDLARVAGCSALSKFSRSKVVCICQLQVALSPRETQVHVSYKIHIDFSFLEFSLDGNTFILVKPLNNESKKIFTKIFKQKNNLTKY